MLGVAAFADDYFCGPLYQDPEKAFYTALGNKPVFSVGTLGKALLNPRKAMRSMKEMNERHEAKGVEGNMKGDGLARGGVMVIDPNGEVRHVFYEDPGAGVPEEECALIVEAARAMEREEAGAAA